jgi:hypothetical protein
MAPRELWLLYYALCCCGGQVQCWSSAIALVRAELEQENWTPFDGDTIVVRPHEIEELSSFGTALVPGRGFTLFPEGT